MKYIPQGFGGMVSFEMHSYEASIKFSNSTKIFKLAVSLGGAESLIEHVCTMTHGDWVMSKEVNAVTIYTREITAQFFMT